MSIARIASDLHELDGASSGDVRGRKARSVRSPLASASSPARPPGNSRQQLGTLIVENMCNLQRFASSLTPRRADAQDLVQETCRKALVAHATFVPGTNVAAWLGCILRNLHRDWLRHGWHEIPVASPGETWAMPVREERPLWTLVSDEEVDRALAMLPPPYRSVYMLRATQGRSYREIAQALRVSEQTVATRLFRARALLRKLLSDRWPDGARSRREISPAARDAGERRPGGRAKPSPTKHPP